VAGDPLYGNAPACGMEVVDLLDDLLDYTAQMTSGDPGRPEWRPGCQEDVLVS
jgi:hypothetical protein